MSRFEQDNAGQRAVRDAVLVPLLYKQISMDGRYVLVDKGRFATLLQRRFEVDTIMQRGRNGVLVAVEEKIVRGEYEAVTLETMSCTVPGHESPGWMQYGEADWLNWVMCCATGDILCHIFDFQKLKDEFWPCEGLFPETRTNQINETLCRKVPIQWIKGRVPSWSHKFCLNEPAREIVLRYRRGHYKAKERAGL